ncbi:uncharacterized protein LOC122366408 [Amphibalanus amphitrite]|nr:uncharacterized protein LOC122366408 [Amphibalanus amphitrite]
MDSTFTMEAAPFRVPLAASADGGGGAPAGGSGQRAVAGKGALRGSASSTHLGVQRTGLSRSASAAHLSQTGRVGGGSRSTAGAPGSAARRGFEASARLAATAPNPSRLSLSAQKARSTSRLHTSASGGRDENQQPDRPAWGRTAPPAVGADKAAGRHGLISSVGKFGLGRSRTGAKDRPGGVLKPANQ